jgi:hypothetical protein
VPSGWLTLGCLFLPSFRFCKGDDPIPMATLLPMWPLLLGGVVIALAAGAANEHALRRRGRRLLKFVQLSVLVPTALIGISFSRRLSSEMLLPTVVACVVTVAVLWATRRRPSPLAIAVVASCVAASHVALCLLFVLDPLRAWGATVSLVVASGLCAGTLWWTAEAARARRRHAQVTSRAAVVAAPAARGPSACDGAGG